METDRPTRSPVLRMLRRALPVLVSVGLVAYLVWKVSPARLAAGAAVLNWPALVALSLVELAALLLWDTVCLRWLFALPDGNLPFGQVLRARCHSSAWMVINYPLSQGVLAWELAPARGLSLAAALGRCVLLLLHDLGVLFGLGLAASFLHGGPLALVLRGICAVGLLVLAGVAVALAAAPGRWRARLGQRVDWFGWWGWRHTLTAVGLRLAFLSIIVVYLAAALWVVGLPQDARGVCGTLPLVVVSMEVVPSVAGFGSRDVAMLRLLRPPREQEAVVLAFTLLWSSVLGAARLLLGLATWWLLPARPPGAAQ
jgi:hypothetical protein